LRPQYAHDAASTNKPEIMEILIGKGKEIALSTKATKG